VVIATCQKWILLKIYRNNKFQKKLTPKLFGSGCNLEGFRPTGLLWTWVSGNCKIARTRPKSKGWRIRTTRKQRPAEKVWKKTKTKSKN